MRLGRPQNIIHADAYPRAIARADVVRASPIRREVVADLPQICLIRASNAKGRMPGRYLRYPPDPVRLGRCAPVAELRAAPRDPGGVRQMDLERVGCRIFSTHQGRLGYAGGMHAIHELSQAVRTRRQEIGLSQQRLATLAGLSRATIVQL